jgi:hypothetical protein
MRKSDELAVALQLLLVVTNCTVLTRKPWICILTN